MNNRRTQKTNRDAQAHARKPQPRHRCRFFFRVVFFCAFAAGLFSATIPAKGLSEDANRQLREELSALSQEIEILRSSVRTTRAQELTLAREVRQIDQEIQRSELSIAWSERAVAQLNAEIASTEAEIATYEAMIADIRGNVANVLRSIAEGDAVPPVAVIFSGRTISEVSDELVQRSRLEEELLGTIGHIRGLEGVLGERIETLEQQRRLEEDAQRLLVMERDELRVKREVRERMLAETRGKEQEFRKRLEATEENAVRIREEIYLLADLGRSMPFGEAYGIAKPLADAVGIRPAFLLAVLQKESRLGALVGTGYWKTDMHSRDWQAFLTITRELGLDPDSVPVSRRPSYGWGGAMGPAQFLPSTWLAYRDRISSMTGSNPPSPWNVRDAFAAAAIKLAAGGATEKTAEAEWRAAMQYFAGGNWRSPSYAFYGDAVEDLTAYFQRQIDILETETRNPKS